MYLNRLLTIFAATVISMTALTSCVVLNEDQPEVKRMLPVNESVSEQGYIVEKGYTMTDSEIFVCFYSRARILIFEEKFTFDRIESAEISSTDNFTFTSEMPHTVEYLVEKPTN